MIQCTAHCAAAAQTEVKTHHTCTIALAAHAAGADCAVSCAGAVGNGEHRAATTVQGIPIGWCGTGSQERQAQAQQKQGQGATTRPRRRAQGGHDSARNGPVLAGRVS
jgi:hypothetical protein